MRESEALGPRRVHVELCGRTIPLCLDSGVFPPRSEHSISSASVAEQLGDLTGKWVADIGCGCGIEAIAAAINGSGLVDATDIYPKAVECTRRSVNLNRLEDRINVFCGDMFAPLPTRRYDLIIANLPIVDCQPEIEDNISRALYDPGFVLHQRLLIEGIDYLAVNGSITFTHANLQSAGTSEPLLDFVRLERLVFSHNYRIAARHIRDELGYRWINYRIQPLRPCHRRHQP